jgi:hypothetical protein
MNHAQEQQAPEPQAALELPGWLIGLGSLLINKELKAAMAQHPYDLLEGMAAFG